jgi:hypothetical protein
MTIEEIGLMVIIGIAGLVWIYGTLAVFYLKKIAHFNRDLHAVLLQSQEAQLRSHLRMRIQSPIKVWREIEQSQKFVEEVLIKAPKIKAKKTVEADQTAPDEPKKIVPKTIQECAPQAHKWVLDKEKNYYCELCGKRF